MSDGPARIDVLGSAITALDMEQALRAVEERLADGRGGYVCFTNVHAVVSARQDSDFRDATNGSFMSLADGKPVFWVARSRGNRSIGHTPGPDFMLEALRRFPRRRHFFYGSTPAVLDKLVERLRIQIPGLSVCGSLSPPFGIPSEAEAERHRLAIRAAGAEFVWVGLGAPKQERWMSRNAATLSPAVLFGVGAAFDFHAGTVSRAPPFMRRLGLEWLYRLAAEPRRLWRRYLFTNGMFVAYVLRDRLSPGDRLRQ